MAHRPRATAPRCPCCRRRLHRDLGARPMPRDPREAARHHRVAVAARPTRRSSAAPARAAQRARPSRAASSRRRRAPAPRTRAGARGCCAQQLGALAARQLRDEHRLRRSPRGTPACTTRSSKRSSTWPAPPGRRTTRCATDGSRSSSPRSARHSCRQVRQQRRRLQEARAERVRHRDVARAHRLHEARHAEHRVRRAARADRSSRRSRGAGSRRPAAAAAASSGTRGRRAP